MILKHRAIQREIKPFVPLKLKLQFFASEGGEGGEGDTGTGNTGTGDQGAASEGEGQVKSFDDILKADKNLQSEFDKKIAKSLETAKAKWDIDVQQKLVAAKTEAEKLAKMTADEKAKFQLEKQESDYSKRLTDLNTRELKATAKDTLASSGLPLELAEVLNYADADSCNKSIEAVKIAFQSSVEKAVNEKLRGAPPKSGLGGGTGATTLTGALTEHYK